MASLGLRQYAKVVVSALALTACSSASGYFHASPHVVVEVETSRFEVRRRGDLAEAVRITPQYAPRLARSKIERNAPSKSRQVAR